MGKKTKESPSIKLVSQVVAKNFKKYRYTAGLTQELIAERANVTIEYLSKLEHGNFNPRVNTIIDLCLAMGITPTQLLSDFFIDKSNGVVELIFEEIDNLTVEDQKLTLELVRRLAKK